ncbi:MAG: AbrB/MazE/SpoVT family DNA-binding domain-containing protein [archaeon]
MEEIEVTSVSSRGQIVIPLNLRNKMNIQTGEKFAIKGDNETIVLKKIELPSFDEFNSLLNKTIDFASEKKLTESDVRNAIKQIRKR